MRQAASRIPAACRTKKTNHWPVGCHPQGDMSCSPASCLCVWETSYMPLCICNTSHDQATKYITMSPIPCLLAASILNSTHLARLK